MEEQQSASLLFFAACICVVAAPASWQAPLDAEGVSELATLKQQVKAPCMNRKDTTRPAVASFLIFLCLSFSATASPDFTILLFSFKLNPYNEFFSKKFPFYLCHLTLKQKSCHISIGTGPAGR